MPETTKDDSSDVQKVQQNKQAPPPQPQDEEAANDRSREAEEAEKGHS